MNPFLEGNFAPVSQEITTDELQVIGQIPTELAGMLVRNGPNPQFPNPEQYHWFAGDGMLHGVILKKGKATYLNRYVTTQSWQREREVGKALNSEQLGGFKNTANTALIWHAGKFLALWEGGEPHLIELPSLHTLGSYHYQGKLESPFTAHPKVDPLTKEMMFFGYSLGQPPYLQYGWISAAGKLQKTVSIDLPIGVMMHDFAITEQYTIFMDLPLTFRPQRREQGESGFKFESNRPSRFGIMPRYGDNETVRWFETSPCYIFHTLNAYEEGEEVVLIACRMSSTNVLGMAEIEDSQADIPQLYQWRFNLRTGKVKEQLLEEISSEFPQMNQQYLGRKARYGYTAKMAKSPLPLMDGIIKHDLRSGDAQIHQFSSGCYGGEAVFIPHPQGTSEDEGWLVTFVYNQKLNRSSLVIINAQEFTDEPVVEVMIPQRVPYGFHGIWLSPAQLSK